MVDRIRTMVSLSGWVSAIGASVTGLHALGRYLPTSAIWSQSGLDLALGAAARWLGLAAGYWLLLTTTIYLAGSLGSLPALVRSVDWATLPWVRQVVDRISARALVRALAAPLPLLDLVAPGYVPVPAGDLPPQVVAPPATVVLPPAPPATELPCGTPTSVQATEAPPAVPAPTEAIEVVVQIGDNMWKLAEARLQALIGRPPKDFEVAPFWWRVVEANRDRIRSGNPDLIFPGETLILPPV